VRGRAAAVAEQFVATPRLECGVDFGVARGQAGQGQEAAPLDQVQARIVVVRQDVHERGRRVVPRRCRRRRRRGSRQAEPVRRGGQQRMAGGSRSGEGRGERIARESLRRSVGSPLNQQAESVRRAGAGAFVQVAVAAGSTARGPIRQQVGEQLRFAVRRASGDADRKGGEPGDVLVAATEQRPERVDQQVVR
jgi:hypothetical protein